MANIGRVVINQPNRSRIVAQNFAPKPNVSLAEISDVTTSGVQNGDTLVFNSATNKYEAKTVTATVTEIIGGTF
jgi:hypothetical protein